jgi:recombinational DNA repair protein RecR
MDRGPDTDATEGPWWPPRRGAARRHALAILALDAGLRELERQGAVKLPPYCECCGAMKQRDRCAVCGWPPA